jgi:putative tricarboxylic transport membrane protein
MLVSAVIGISIGIIAGLIPGFGIFTSLIVLYPFLLKLDPLNLLCLYVGLASATQFSGSVSAIIYGVPGEQSSMPAVTEGHKLFRMGQGDLAISGSAIGSFFGSFITVAFVFALFPYIENVMYLFSSLAQLIILLLVTIFLILSGNIIKNTLMCLFAYFLGAIGTHSYLHEGTFMTFGNADLTTGIPMFPVVLALFVVPQLYQASSIGKHTQKVAQDSFRVSVHFKNFIRHWSSALRGTVLGFFAGMCPGLSTTLSSTLSYAVEKKLEKGYQQGSMKCLIASETANNSGSFSMLIPLLIFGIPIVPSEALLYDINASKGFIFGSTTFDITIFYTVVFVLMLANCVSLIMCWPFAKYIAHINRVDKRLMNSIVLLILAMVMVYIGSYTWQAWYYIIVFLTLLPFAYLLRNQNTLPLIFVFLVQDRLETLIYRMPMLFGIN